MNEYNRGTSKESGEEIPEIFSEDRRFFLKTSAAFAGLSVATPSFLPDVVFPQQQLVGNAADLTRISLWINGKKQSVDIDPRTTLLDLLRENLGLTGTKKGCDFGQCGACTVHADGQRVLACLSLAIMQSDKKIRTIEGLSDGEKLHPLQEAFIRHDGFQCGFCTPGQLMSAVCCIREGKAGSEPEIREYMSGNLCRCGAYPNIVDAIVDVRNSGGEV